MDVKFQTILENIIGREQVVLKQEMIDHWWNSVLEAYSQPQRHYHTIEHIKSMWALLDSVPQQFINDINAVGFAIFFHEWV